MKANFLGLTYLGDYSHFDSFVEDWKNHGEIEVLKMIPRPKYQTKHWRCRRYLRTWRMYQVVSGHRLSRHLGCNGQVDLGIWREDCNDEIEARRSVTVDLDGLCLY